MSLGPDKKATKANMIADAEALLTAVDSVIPEYLVRTLPVFKKTGKTSNVVESRMQPEYNTRVDFNVEMKSSALRATLRDISDKMYPHYESVKIVINYVLMGTELTDFGLVSEIFGRLRFFHPVYAHTEYYKKILLGSFVTVKKKTNAETPFFWFIVDEILSLTEMHGNDVAYDPYPPSPALEKDMKASEMFPSSHSVPKKVAFVNDLKPCDKWKRLIFCLEAVMGWLEDDFAEWATQGHRSSRRPLLAQLVWPNPDSEGQCTQLVQKMLNLIDCNIDCFQRVLVLLAELVREQDRIGIQQYPFIGNHSIDFARELSCKLLTIMKDKSIEACDAYLWSIETDWLRLVCVSNLLSDLTGFQCAPEIHGAVAIMRHLEHIYKVGRQESRRKEAGQQLPADEVLVAKFARFKSVNTCFRTGMTRLHTACHDNNEEAVRALLTFPLLDLNSKDTLNRTPLHEACRRGSEGCVRLLLDHAPPVGSLQRRVNTRAVDLCGHTPLMLAAEAGHTEICKLMLQHSGSILLEDVADANRSSVDFCESEETLAVLQYYKKNQVETIYSKPEITLDTRDLVLVASLCVILVQSYMEVHRTWEVYHAMKKSVQAGAGSGGKGQRQPPTVLCEYSRYHRDFRTHVPSVRLMAAKLKKIPQLAAVTDFLFAIVSFNK